MIKTLFMTTGTKNIMSGDIALVPFPFTDLTAAKTRPSVEKNTFGFGDKSIVSTEKKPVTIVHVCVPQ
ncbi:hypothetical protein [Candidatus Magnetominusculus dajiuhuensis]|uniref:hypothetical protein n=1 Tax=Candidatus Magnetominusculus dajiuhuensis TaxID=3137712 RepID=UPI003B42C63C